jgi:hypothetical protein
MQFSNEDLQKLQESQFAVFDKYQKLIEAYAIHKYSTQQGHQYAMQGFLRRLGLLARCINNVFEILPPDRIVLPTPDELSDAEINIHAFVVNLFGSADNLARIWALEKSLTRPDGSPVPKEWIGLRKNNELVRRSFSAEFQEYLNKLDPWFDLLENFRHALAHRIPIYIPPYTVTDNKKKAYHELENRMTAAFDVAEYERLSAEQKALAVFVPFMTHAFEEEAEFVVFHAQLLADFNTIEDLAQRILGELNR